MSCNSSTCTNNSIRNYDRSVRKGEHFELSGRTNDDTVASATLKVWNDTGIKLTETGTFVDRRVTIDAGIIDLPLGEYKYSLTITYLDGKPDILPNPLQCDGTDPDCGFPVLTVCSGGYDG